MKKTTAAVKRPAKTASNRPKKAPIKSKKVTQTPSLSAPVSTRRRLLVRFASFGSLAAALVIIAGLTHHAGPLNAVFSPVSKTAPFVQPDTTKLYSSDGLASTKTVLVKFKAGVPGSRIAAIHKQIGGQVRATIAGIGVQEVQLPAGADVGASLKAYRAHSEVAYAEPNFVAQRFSVPNDPLYAQQWNLAKINAPAAWDVSQGGYGPIAVIDTGIDAAHSDLSGEVEAGYNFVDNTSNTADDNGHGTHVAGIIAATTNNNNGIASIGYKGLLMPVKVLDSTGSGTYANLASGIIYAADNGAKIINMSLGGSSASSTLQSAVNYAEQKGVIIVAAAGNNGNSAAVYPADYPGVIAVSATDTNDNLASFSSYGPDITVSAPGVNIVSTYNTGGYATMSGTSMASPEVAGLLGLALSHGSISEPTLLSDLESTSDKVGGYPYNSSGWNEYYGYGRIDAGKLMQLVSTAPASTTTATSPTPTASGSQTVHGQPSMQFSVDLEGTIDSINTQTGVISVKISSISQNLKLADNNLIDVFVTGTTTIQQGNQRLALSSLVPGQQIGGKGLWQNNQLLGTTLTVQARPTSPAPTTSVHATAGSGASNAPAAPSQAAQPVAPGRP